MHNNHVKVCSMIRNTYLQNYLTILDDTRNSDTRDYLDPDWFQDP